MDKVRLIVLENCRAPVKCTEGSAGYDLYTARQTTIAPRGALKVPLGVRIALPQHLFAKIVGRSSTAFKGLHCVTGIIDSDYVGELHATLQNFTDKPVVIEKGERVVQIVFLEKKLVEFEHVEQLKQTTRSGGYGSTGDF